MVEKIGMDGYKESKEEGKGIELKEEVQWTWVRVGDKRIEKCLEVRMYRDGNVDG